MNHNFFAKILTSNGEKYIDALYDACGNVTLSYTKTKIIIEFNRNAKTIYDATVEALKDIEKVFPLSCITVYLDGRTLDHDGVVVTFVKKD